MQPYRYDREFILKIGDGREPKPVRNLSWHESMGTLALGALSTSLGCAVLASFLTRAPSFDMIITAYVGQCLGMAGIYLSRRRNRGQAPLAILGTVLCLIPLSPFYLALFVVLLGLMSLIALPFYAMRILNRYARD